MMDAPMFARTMNLWDYVYNTDMVPAMLLEMMERYARVVCFRADNKVVPLSFTLTWDATCALASCIESAIVIEHPACHLRAYGADEAVAFGAEHLPAAAQVNGEAGLSAECAITGLVHTVFEDGPTGRPHDLPCASRITSTCPGNVFQGHLFDRELPLVTSTMFRAGARWYDDRDSAIRIFMAALFAAGQCCLLLLSAAAACVVAACLLLPV